MTETDGDPVQAGSQDSVPLVVDLDGTLTPVDTLHEAAIGLFAAAPFRSIAQLPGWLARGKAHLKHQIASCQHVNPALLPWSEQVLERIRSARAEGRETVLCTASDRDTARRIADHLGVFDKVIASDGQTNLAGRNKAEALVAAYGEGGFDYIGNAPPDIAVWSHARHAIVVSNNEKLIARARAVTEVEMVLSAPRATVRVWTKQLRLHQWAKNLLLFVPVIASQRFTEAQLVWQVIMGFVVFGIIASATYVLNDLFDLDADRLHAQKRERPLAAGTISTLDAVLCTVLGLVLGFGFAGLIGAAFLLTTLVYLIATVAYSFAIKRVVLLDCIWLAGLFTLRIVAGAAIIGSALSHWLFIFSVFLFLSLAYLKRYIELQGKARKQKVAGRGYTAEDLPMVFALGVGAGYASTVVLSLYLFSPQALTLYGNSYYLVVAIPIMIYWLSYMWHRAHRGEMHYDPVLFALRDRISLLTVAAFFIVFILGAAIPY